MPAKKKPEKTSEVRLSGQRNPAAETPPHFQQVERQRLSDRVAQELLRLIARGELAPGDRLPGERQLAELMKVSRVSVRAALQQLKAQGIVASVQGGGTRVVAAAEEIDSGLTQLVMADADNLHDLAEIRANLEVWAARRAAQHAGAEQIAEIEAAFAAMADPKRPARFKAEDDLRFHMAIARASGSAVYMHLMTILGDVLERSFAYHRYSLYATEEDDKRFLEQHRRIADAIKAGDPEAAAERMREHLASVLSKYGVGAESRFPIKLVAQG